MVADDATGGDGGAAGVGSGVVDVSAVGGFVAVSAGWEHTCAVRVDSTVACWGDGHFGQAGPLSDHHQRLHDEDNYYAASPDDMPTGPFAAVSAGGDLTCALRTDASAACWGSPYHNPYQPELRGRFGAVAAGGWHTCALRVEGTVDCWGLNDRGTFLDLGEHSQRPRPCLVLNAAGNDYYLDSTGEHPTCRYYPPRCVAFVDGEEEYCWSGAGEDPAGTFSSISAGGAHTCGLRADETVTCWGYGPGGEVDMPKQLYGGGVWDHFMCSGRPSSSFNDFPCGMLGDVGQADAPPGRFSAVAAGGWHTCGLRVNGSVDCWGDNTHGQTDAPDGRYTAVAAGWTHTCAVRAGDSVLCWGDNTDGQTDAPPGRFTAVAAGGVHTCALAPDATITCWGSPGHIQPPNGVTWVT